jgi:hypothetical protein
VEVVRWRVREVGCHSLIPMFNFMYLHADNHYHEEYENHVVRHRSHLQPVPLLLGWKYVSMENARQSIKHQLQDSGLPSATMVANKIRFCLVCLKSLSNTRQQCDFIVTARLQIKVE